ncbi:MAG TPA: hypothetical protein DCP91_09390 [Eggerthellaceae bacterium]|nr:hypothetical protein [Eggerthellaceae bacterium]
MAKLYGIDVSGGKNQPANICDLVDYDFAIVKMSGNPQYDGNGRALAWNYVNPAAKRQASDVVKRNKPLGLYHFTWGKQAEVEAEFFIEQVRKLGCLGKAMLVIDYEAQALERGQTWVGKLAKRVEQLAGYKPVIYASGGVIVSQSLFSLGYPIWCASYPISYEPIYGYDPQGSIYPGCENAIMWQYTSQGYIEGYDGPLDCNVFFGSETKFRALMGKSSTPVPEPKPAKKTLKRGQVAADIHKLMVQDERFGYSWEERYGAKSEKWTVKGLVFSIMVGDYDCSSSTITAWKKALTGTPYEGALDGATYTGNMRSVFVGSGLFSWKPISFIASPGDLYLNEANHVAMCQQQVPDELSEFSWGDRGAYGNKRGDQSGFESRVNPYYDYPWDGILHYNGKADTPIPDPQPEPKPATRTFRVTVDELNVREKPSTSARATRVLKRGKTVKADRVVVRNGYRWASWKNSKGNRRYAAIRTQDKSERFMKRMS